MDSQLIEDFLLEKGYSRSTCRIYRYALGEVSGWIAQLPGKLEDLQPVEVLRWMQDKHSNWGESQRHNVACAIKAFLRWQNGTAGKLEGLKIPRHAPGPQRTLSDEEVAKVHAYLETREGPVGVRDRALFALMLDTGLRSSEVVGLRWSEIDFEDLSFSTRIKGGDTAKGLFSPMTAERLKAWRAARAEWDGVWQPKFEGDDPLLKRAATMLDAEGPGDLVFTSVGGLQPGEPITRGGLRLIMARIAREAGIKRFSPHALRRTFACMALKRGASVRLVQMLGRWSDLDMVLRYSQELELESARDFLPLG